MATLKVTVFLFFVLFHILKGKASTVSVATTETNPTISTGTINKGETTIVTKDHQNSSLTWGETTSRDASSLQSTATTTSSNTSVTDNSTIVPSTGIENISDTTSSEKNETTVDTSTAAQTTFISVVPTAQSAYSRASTSKAEITDPASGLESSIAPTTSGSNSLSVLAFAVIILILILVILVVILVSVISLRFKCCDNEDASQDGRKTRNAAPSESSQVNGEKESITLVSMRTLTTEAGGQESSLQGSLQNDSVEAGEPDKHFQQINNAKLV
ncbi:uncharacterized protein LOC144505488 isoform X1 [Mustelus asterias]